jgi:ABC-type multidrug transport system fused ATPase/permease subunit
MVSASIVGHETDSVDFKPNLVTTLRVIGFLIRPYAWIYASILVLSIIEGLLGGLAIAALFPLFKFLAGLSVSGGGTVLAWIQRIALALPIRPPIVSAGCFLLLVGVLKCAVAMSRDTLIGYAGAEVGYHLKRQMLHKYVGGGYPFFLNHRQGELTYNLYAGCLRMGGLFNHLSILFAQVVSILPLLALLFSIHVKATMALLVFAAALHVGASWVSRRVYYPIGKARKDCMVSQQVIVTEFIAGFKQIFVFGTVPALARIHNEVNRRFRNLLTKEAALLASPKNAWEFLTLAGGAAVMMWIGVRNPGGLSGHVVTLGVYLVALQRLLPFMSTLSRHYMAVYGSLPDAFTIYNCLSSSLAARSQGGRVAAPLSKAVRFERVRFSYPDRGVILKDVDMLFERGKVTAIVGASGAGKTTILNLILGLFEPTSGAIRIDEVDLKEIRLDSWLAQIGFVSQDTFIFNGTVGDNIAFFRECSQEEIEEAARLANAHDFIMEFPLGYDTVVGDRGMRISGGQQQRLALARAILKKPGVFVLDEATSSLDSISESLIQDSLRKIAVNRTVIVVAHRLSTVVNADNIFVLKEGVVVGEGTHGELLRARGHYFQIYGGEPLPAWAE